MCRRKKDAFNLFIYLQLLRIPMCVRMRAVFYKSCVVKTGWGKNVSEMTNSSSQKKVFLIQIWQMFRSVFMHTCWSAQKWDLRLVDFRVIIGGLIRFSWYKCASAWSGSQGKISGWLCWVHESWWLSVIARDKIHITTPFGWTSV